MSKSLVLEVVYSAFLSSTTEAMTLKSSKRHKMGLWHFNRFYLFKPKSTHTLTIHADGSKSMAHSITVTVEEACNWNRKSHFLLLKSYLHVLFYTQSCIYIQVKQYFLLKTLRFGTQTRPGKGCKINADSRRS